MSILHNFILKFNIIHKKFFLKKKYYSFSGVDVIVEDIFRHKNNGIYIDIGCQHPIKNNKLQRNVLLNLRLFIEFPLL